MSEGTLTPPSETATAIRRWLWARFVNLLPNEPRQRIVTASEAPEDLPADYQVEHMIAQSPEVRKLREENAELQDLVDAFRAERG